MRWISGANRILLTHTLGGLPEQPCGCGKLAPQTNCASFWCYWMYAELQRCSQRCLSGDRFAHIVDGNLCVTKVSFAKRFTPGVAGVAHSNTSVEGRAKTCARGMANDFVIPQNRFATPQLNLRIVQLQKNESLSGRSVAEWLQPSFSDELFPPINGASQSCFKRCLGGRKLMTDGAKGLFDAHG